VLSGAHAKSLQGGEHRWAKVESVGSGVDDGGMAVVDISRGVMTSQILIVEDAPTLAEVPSRVSRRDGYEVAVATDGLSGLAPGSCGDHDLLVWI
jgi:hypothetical protein